MTDIIQRKIKYGTEVITVFIRHNDSLLYTLMLTLFHYFHDTF